MKKPDRAVIQLTRWKKRRDPKPTDPDYGGRVEIPIKFAQYVADCVASGSTPEMFVTVWLNEVSGKAAMGIAIPFDYIPSRQIEQMEADFQWEEEWRR